ncbi:MAG: hypothetical protein ACJAUH_001502 [Saprospiraceae bacterium]|jgi:hypothetical protein
MSKGLNYLEYDLSIDEKVVKSYEKSLNKENKKADNRVEVEMAENDVFYLQKGKYMITIEANGETMEKALVIYIPKKRGGSTPNPEGRERD